MLKIFQIQFYPFVQEALWQFFAHAQMPSWLICTCKQKRALEFVALWLWWMCVSCFLWFILNSQLMIEHKSPVIMLWSPLSPNIMSSCGSLWWCSVMHRAFNKKCSKFCISKSAFIVVTWDNLISWRQGFWIMTNKWYLGVFHLQLSLRF